MIFVILCTRFICLNFTYDLGI